MTMNNPILPHQEQEQQQQLLLLQRSRHQLQQQQQHASSVKKTSSIPKSLLWVSCYCAAAVCFTTTTAFTTTNSPRHAFGVVRPSSSTTTTTTTSQSILGRLPQEEATTTTTITSSSSTQIHMAGGGARRTSRTPVVVAQPVQPKKTISDKRRRAAIAAMDRTLTTGNNDSSSQQTDVALTGADAQLLEALLSAAQQQQQKSKGKATSPSTPNTRPRGRPDCVPGAMNFETMLKFREQQEKKRLEEAKVMAASSSIGYTTPENQSSIWRSLRTTPAATNDNSNAVQDDTVTTTPKKRGKGRPRKNPQDTTTPSGTFLKNGTTKKFKPVKGTTSAKTTSLKQASASETNNNNNSGKQDGESSSPKKRKRVVKNLPPSSKRRPRNSSSSPTTSTVTNNQKQPKFNRRAGNKNDPLNLHRYYRTELLSADEEYSLGMKIQFMMQCELVHEGLCENLLRLPSLEEWAVACGFDEVSNERFIPTEADEKIRPAGAETMFEEQNPHMFVGNGLATHAGPGRGRGRAKKPAPTTLGDFYDDSTERFPSLLVDDDSVEEDEETVPNENDMRSSSRRTREDSSSSSSLLQKQHKTPQEPINRGTPLDFLEMMYTAKEAKQRMVQCNMRLVVSIARKYSNVGVNLQDLVQEGSLGLTRAAEKFEPSKGFKFSTYASWWIQQAVFRSIAYHSRTIRLPVHVHNLLNRVRRVRMTLEQDLGRSPTNEEIAEQLDMSTSKFNKMLRLTRRSISLEMPKYQSNPKDLGHESEDLLGDTIDAAAVVQDESSPEKRVDRRLFHEDLREMLEILEDDERKVICARYGLSDGLTRTVTAVAAQMKESKAWVRSQECRALRKLRRPWYEKRLKEHQNSLTN